MRLLYISIVSFILIGCQDANIENDIQDSEDTEISTPSTIQGKVHQYNEYLWHLFYTPNDFSTSNAISKNANINILKAWDITKGNGVKIAVIDESFEPTHEDIKDNIILTYNASNGSNDVSPYSGKYSHGNSCAGHISAIDNHVGIIGAAPESKLILIKYGYDDASIIRAFNKALEEGVQVISCSWGSYNISESVNAKLRDAYEAGVTVVFAVGNDGFSLDSSSIDDESESPYVLAIGASCENNEVCSYSNYGEALDFIAPGGEHYNTVGILSLDNTVDGAHSNTKNLINGNYSFESGTSYSTPLVAGVVALMYSIKPNITPLEVRTILINSAKKIGDGVVYNNGFNIKRGYGKIDAFEALKLVSNKL